MRKARISDATEAALELLKKAAVQRAPVPVEKVAKSLGAQVRYLPLDKELSGMAFIKDGVPVIGVNALHHPNRQRFTIAHETGHLILHRDLITQAVHFDKDFPMLRRDALSAAGINPIEMEANAFAAELLMPESLVKQMLGNRSFDIDDDKFINELARSFKVSAGSMQLRLGNLLGR